jgi:hypothetical protein
VSCQRSMKSASFWNLEELRGCSCRRTLRIDLMVVFW